MALSPFKRTKFEHTFHVLDNNNSGQLDWQDFANVATALQASMGWTDDSPKLAELRVALRRYWMQMLELMDTNGDGEISQLEYLTFYERFSQELPTFSYGVPAWALDLFVALHRAVDADNDGCISQAEYATYLAALGSDADAQAAFVHIDLDGDGFIDVDEVEQLFAQYVTSDDPADPGNWFVDGGGWD